MPPFDPTKALIKAKKDAEVALDLLGKNAAMPIKEAMQLANKKVNGSYPIAYEHMKRSIDGKGNIKHAANSKIAKEILNSKELQKLARKYKAGICLKKTQIFFSSNQNLARTLYRATLTGDLDIKGKTFTFKGEVTDVYDFRFDLIPAKTDLKGFALRYAGNAAYIATQMKLMKSYKITVQIDGTAKR